MIKHDWLYSSDDERINKAILNDELKRSIQIVKDSGPRGWSYLILHPIKSANHLRSVTAQHPLIEEIHHHEDQDSSTRPSTH